MRRLAFAAAVLVTGTLAGCSSSSGASAADPSANAVSAPTASGLPSSPASTVPASYAATGTASDSQGDTATVSISVGAPVPLTSVGVGNVSPCDEIGENFNYQTDQWMATPVQVTVTLTSSLDVPVTMAIDGTNEIDTSGNAQPSGNLPGWASSAQDASNCQAEAISWNNVASGHAVSWSGWLMDPDVITPDDPNGSSAKTEIFLLPNLDFGSGNADFKPEAAASHNLVDCGEVTPGPEIAVDRSLALSRGCTAYTGG
jgi:hypothetical protein